MPEVAQAGAELVLCFFKSKDGARWDPIERDKIPEWLAAAPESWPRLYAGGMVRNAMDDALGGTGMWWWTATAVNRSEPVAVRHVMMPRRFVGTNG